MAIESCREAVREMVTAREPEQIQTVYLAQETQGGGDEVMTETEEPAGNEPCHEYLAVFGFPTR